MRKKKIYSKLLFCILFSLNILLATENKIHIKKLHFGFKIPTVSDHHEYQILKNDSICIDEEGEVLVLSRKNAELYRFNKKGQYIGKSFRKGQGPNELSYPTQMTILPNRCLLILNNLNQIKLFKSINHQWTQITQFSIALSDISEIVSIKPNIIGILTTFSLMPKLKKNNKGYFIHLYNLEEKRILSHFFSNKMNYKNSQEMRSTYGNGDIILWNNKILVVFNQPSDMFIFSLNGRYECNISTKFPFLKSNQPIFKKIKSNGVIQFQVYFANNCQMNFVTSKSNIYLLTRVNLGNYDDPNFIFYLNRIDLRQKRIVSHLRLNFESVNISSLTFKTFFDNRLIFFDEDWLYFFNL